MTTEIASRPDASAPSAELLDALASAREPGSLIAVGMAIHHFADLVPHGAITETDLHRATTILAKQVAAHPLDETFLDAVLALVTDPERPALGDGRSTADLCGSSWSVVRDAARERALAAIEGAETYGRDAILRLAAMRAADGSRPWWGTVGWAERVDHWLAANPHDPLLVPMLLRAPEYVDDDILGAVLARPSD